MKDPQEILHKFLSSKFLVAQRSNGYVCPGSMRLVDFQTAIDQVRFWGAGTGIRWGRQGLYLLESNGDFVNVHRKILTLLKSGLLEISMDENTGRRVVRIKEGDGVEASQ